VRDVSAALYPIHYHRKGRNTDEPGASPRCES
jgi:hypothetical protein